MLVTPSSITTAVMLSRLSYHGAPANDQSGISPVPEIVSVPSTRVYVKSESGIAISPSAFAAGTANIIAESITTAANSLIIPFFIIKPPLILLMPAQDHHYKYFTIYHSFCQVIFVFFDKIQILFYIYPFALSKKPVSLSETGFAVLDFRIYFSLRNVCAAGGERGACREHQNTRRTAS